MGEASRLPSGESELRHSNGDKSAEGFAFKVIVSGKMRLLKWNVPEDYDVLRAEQQEKRLTMSCEIDRMRRNPYETIL